MTSTSSEPVVLRDLPVGAVAVPTSSVDLRAGAWTRLGAGNLLGDRVAEATLEAVATRSHEAARAQGFAAGWAEGMRAAGDRVAAHQEQQARIVEERTAVLLAEQEAAGAALGVAVARAEQTLQTLQAGLAEEAVELALQIAEALVGHAVTTAEDPSAAAVRRAVAGVPVETPIVVHLHPADVALLDEGVLAGRPASLLADAGVARGDALVEHEAGWVETGTAAAMARVREVLGR